MKDLPHFLIVSVSPDVLENNFEELLHLYHSKLLDYLKKLKCETEPFSKESFDKQLQRDASDQFLRCMPNLKVYTVDINENEDLKDLKSILMTPANDYFRERLWKALSKFVEKGWL